MAPSKPSLSSSAAAPKPSSGRPKIFGGGTRQSARIEKKSAENERTKKQDQGSTEAEPEENVQPQQVTPSSQSTQTQSSHRPEREALPSERRLQSTADSRNTSAGATNQDAFANAGEDESLKPALYHTISEQGPRLKNIAELIMDTDTYENFRIPSDKIIANEDVDTMVYEQMRRLAKDGELTPNRVRAYLIDSVKEFEDCWRFRSRSLAKFWKRACMCVPGTPGTWMNQLGGADCRQFFLWLLLYFRHGSGREGSNNLIRAFERLTELFKEEEKDKDSELNTLVGIQQRLQQPAKRSRGRSRRSTGVRRGAALKKRGSQKAPEDGNIFRWSADTNMTDFELSGIDAEGLTPIVDVGDARRKNEELRRQFYEEIEADRERIEAEEKAALEAAAMPKPQPTTQGMRRSSRKPPTPPEVDDLTPEMGVEEPAKAGRKLTEFEEDREDEGEEEKMLGAAAVKRQRLLKRHAARGGPKSD